MDAALSSPAAPSSWLSKAERDLLVLSTSVKALLFHAYRSTDFEVHRNWLAITHSLPLSRWYYEDTSQWTLDYPPFFAYFERFWSQFAFLVDPAITRISSQPFEGWSAVAFQRMTVILSELVLAAALLSYSRSATGKEGSTAFIVAASVLLHPGLVLVDHVHFQYNGFLLGLLTWSLLAAGQGKLTTCAALFASLLNFKHIFIYIAPAFFVFLLRAHCWTAQGFQSDRLVQLAVIVVAICSASFGPFLLASGFDGIGQIISRLFPFQRGLLHAYPAANVWVLLSAVDRVLIKYLTGRGVSVDKAALGSTTRGIVGDTTFGVLPQITPKHCFALTAAFLVLFLSKLWSDPSHKRFVHAVVISAYTSFLFGWHVHEKAALLFLVPLSFLATQDWAHYRIFVVSSCAGIFALFPLLIHSDETLFKLAYSALWGAITFQSLGRSLYRPAPTALSLLVHYAENTYLALFPLLQAYVSLGHSLLFGNAEKVAFVPLLLTSTYCAVGITWSWLRLGTLYMLE